MPRKPRRPKRITKKQKKLVKALTKGLTITDAGKVAGYAHRQAAHNAYKIIKLRFHPALEAAGYNVDNEVTEIYAKMKALREAKKIERHAHQGIVMETHIDDDGDLQLRAANDSARFLGIIGNGHDDPTTAHPSAPIVINLGFLDPATAARILEAQPDSSADSRRPDIHENRDEDPGRPGPSEAVQAVPPDSLP